MYKQLYRSNTVDSKYLHESISLYLKEIYDVMKECYGPYGSHILIDGQIRPEATKDGKTILSKIRTDGTISNAVHGSIISVANKQVEEVGDGSTTTILLLCRLYEKFLKIIDEYKLSPTVLNDKIKHVVDMLLDELKKESTNIIYQNATDDSDDAIPYLINYDLLYQAIHTSVDGNKDLAEKILEMFKELNTPDPLVLIEMSNNENHRYELVKGVESSGTVIRPDIFFNGLSRMEYIDPMVIIVNGRLDMSLEHFINCSEYAMREGKDIIFLATGINEETLNGIATIARTNPGCFARVPVFQIRNSALDEEFGDLCASIGAKPVDSETFKRVASFGAVENIIKNSSGSCSKALLTEFCARFNNPTTDIEATKLRIDEINEKIADLKEDPSSHNERLTDLEDRKAFLSRHYAKFYVGGYSPQRKSINYELASDGIPQAISCMKYGIVPGCNCIIPYIIKEKIYKNHLIHCIDKAIIDAIHDSYMELMLQLLLNRYNEEDAMVELNKVNVTNKQSFNMRQDDEIAVINSADTDRAILQNATDMAALLATSRAFISRNTEFDVVKRGYDDPKPSTVKSPNGIECDPITGAEINTAKEFNEHTMKRNSGIRGTLGFGSTIN